MPAAADISLNLHPDCANLPPPLAQQLLEARLQLAKLCGHGCVGRKERPAGIVDRTGLDMGRQCLGQTGANGFEAGIRVLNQLLQPKQRGAAAQRLFDAQRIGCDRRRSR